MKKKKELEKAHEVSELKVGRYYLVAVAVLTEKFGGKTTEPIVPILHNDHFAHESVGEHYHFDTRFFNDSEGAYTNDVLPAVRVARIEYVKKKCKRVEGGLHLEKIALHANVNSKTMEFIEWYDKMEGVSVKIDEQGRRICPHKGAVMSQVGDKFVCPMHRLKACGKTNKILGRQSEGFWNEIETNLQNVLHG